MLNFDINNWFSNYDWEGLFVSFGTTVLKIIGIFIAYIIVKKIGQKILDRTFSRVFQRQEISPGRALTLQKLAENIFTYALIFIVAATLFNVLGIPVASLIAGAGIVGLAIGFGAQGLVSDVVTGFFLLLEKQIDVNDYVTIGSFEGIVEAVGLRTTQVRSLNGTLHYIPNREIKNLSNHSRGRLLALVDVGVSKLEDTDDLVRILKKACEKVAEDNPVIVEGPNVLGVQASNASEVFIRVVAKTENLQQRAVEEQLRTAIDSVLDEHGIDLSSPKEQKNMEQRG